MRKLSSNEFIDKSNQLHNYKYDYSLVEYINSSKKVKIICKEHGIFEQTPNNHLSGSICKKCAYVLNGINSRSNVDEFILKSKKIHFELYDYSLVIYDNNKKKVKIICKEHGVFEQRPDSHLSGMGCYKCFKFYKKTNEEFINESNLIHNNIYDYSLVEYTNTNTKVKIICKEHGIFEKSPISHLYTVNGGGCQKCKPNYKLCKDTFISKSIDFHRDKYDYSKVEIVNSHTPVIIICKKHGEFSQKPHKHMQKRGCPRCKNSKGVNKICNILDNNNILYEMENTIERCVSSKGKLLHFDIYIPGRDIYIEYDGEQHFIPVKNWGGYKSFNALKERDSLKDNFCYINNIKLFNHILII